MRPESYHPEDLARVLRRTKIATMPELKKALGTKVDVTVFRKLKQLAYRTSYSHPRELLHVGRDGALR